MAHIHGYRGTLNRAGLKAALENHTSLTPAEITRLVDQVARGAVVPVPTNFLLEEDLKAINVLYSPR